MRSLAGTWSLVRLALRLDRVRLPIWILTLTLVVAVFAASIGELYPTTASREQLARAVRANPALLALLGPIFDPTSVGGLTAWRMSFFPLVLVPLMALLTITRHTRAEEEAGRLELLGGTVVGRRAPLTAAFLVATGASFVLGLLVAVAMAVNGEPVAGSVALGLSYTAAGTMFAAVATVTAQVTTSSRAASGLAGAVLGVAYFLRAVGDAAGDTGPTWLSWLSPTGWTLLARPFADERWWVLGLVAALVVLLVVVADVLVERRDFGAGLLADRAGRAQAAPSLGGPLAHAWRLQRGALIAWAFGLFALGTVYGALAENIGDFLDDAPGLRELFERIGGEQVLVDGYLATTMGIFGLIAGAFAAQATLRLRSEETALRAEPVLATGVGRLRWSASHLAVALAGTALLLAAAGFGEGLAHGLRVGDSGGQVPRLVGAALVQLPACAVVAGVALALFGLIPRLAIATWAALVLFLLLTMLGPLLQLDQWVLNLSPYAHVPRLPSEDLAAPPLAALLAVATGLVAAGLAGFRHRDIG